MQQDARLHVEQSTSKAILLMCLATAFFTGIDTTGKYLVSVSQLPPSQVIWVRFLGQFLTIVLVLGLIAVPKLARATRPGLQITRSLLLLASTAFNFLALKYLRLDQTTTINFLAPLTVALLAGPFLGEWVGWRRMLAILVGFCGILVAVRPGFTTFEPAFILSFGCMLAYACFILLTRHLAPYDSSEVTLFWSLLAGTFLVAPLAIMEWVWPRSPLEWALVVTIGMWGAIGHWIFIVAYRYAPAPVLAPFVYISLVTHSTAGFLVFGHVPDIWTLGGAAIVIASGIYLWHRERVRAIEAARGHVPSVAAPAA
jgi:drug/metabolite transporter (DMT)-like permease